MGNLSEILIPIEHTLVDGVYTRIAYAKEGTMIVGAGHNKGGVAILLSGTIQQIDGDTRYEITAPKIFNTFAGTQRIALALTDCAYATCHSTEATTVDEAETLLFEGTSQLTRIRKAYSKFLLTSNKTEEDAQTEMSSLPIIVEESDKYYIGPSSIQGNGCYSSIDFGVYDVIGTAVLNSTRLGLARYVNHSDIPNCAFIRYEPNSIALVAIKEIQANNELLVDYSRQGDI